MTQKSVGIYEKDNLIYRKIIQEDTLTVGNSSCDIPIPGEERLLFAIEMGSDEEIGHIFMCERMPLVVNTIRYEQSPIEIHMGDTIHLDTGITLRLFYDEYVPEETAEVPKAPPIVLVSKEMEILQPKPLNGADIEKQKNSENSETIETVEELPPIKQKQTQKTITDYFTKK